MNLRKTPILPPLLFLKGSSSATAYYYHSQLVLPKELLSVKGKKKTTLGHDHLDCCITQDRSGYHCAGYPGWIAGSADTGYLFGTIPHRAPTWVNRAITQVELAVYRGITGMSCYGDTCITNISPLRAESSDPRHTFHVKPNH